MQRGGPSLFDSLGNSKLVPMQMIDNGQCLSMMCIGFCDRHSLPSQRLDGKKSALSTMTRNDNLLWLPNGLLASTRWTTSLLIRMDPFPHLLFSHILFPNSHYHFRPKTILPMLPPKSTPLTLSHSEPGLLRTWTSPEQRIHLPWDGHPARLDTQFQT